MSGQGTLDPASGAAGKARRAGESEGLEHLARVGLVGYGLVHVLVAWLALQLAWGGGSGAQPDQSGALAALAEQPFGRPLLWALAVGLIALAVWQAAEVLRWRRRWSASGKEGRTALGRSAKAVAKAVIYLALAAYMIRFATGSGGGSGRAGSSGEQQAAAGVFGWPGGRWLVGAAGLILLGIAVYHVHKGVTKRFLEQIDLADAPPRAVRLVTRLGQAGYPGKGVALGIVGALLVRAAITADPTEAAGLDGALQRVLQTPFGPALLTLIAVGIAAYGGFCFVRARYPQRT